MARRRTTDHDPDGLELEQDLEFQAAEWNVQRAAWVAMTVLVLAALAGLFGPGPLSTAHAGREGDPLEIRYHRFTRYGVDTELEVRVRHDGAKDSLALRFDRAFLERFDLVQVVPEPVAQSATAVHVVHTFRIPGGGEATILYRVEPKRVGRAETAVTAGGAAAPVRVALFVYP